MKFHLEAFSKTVPEHFADRITDYQWNFIQNKAKEISDYLQSVGRPLPSWIFSNWFITYCMNPTKENREYMFKGFERECIVLNALDQIELLETLLGNNSERRQTNE